ncbi:hypothetical protein NQZ68_010418 [Dissostichus eleginoides]|nr:hypothetical protein NQZ68_010418 [Dissostichus eleginoides]
MRAWWGGKPGNLGGNQLRCNGKLSHLLLHASLKDEREAPLSHAMYDEEGVNARQMKEKQYSPNPPLPLHFVPLSVNLIRIIICAQASKARASASPSFLSKVTPFRANREGVVGGQTGSQSQFWVYDNSNSIELASPGLWDSLPKTSSPPSYCCFHPLLNSSLPLSTTPLSRSLAADRPLRAKGKQMAASLSNSTTL